MEQQPSDKEKITTKVTTSYDNKNLVAVKPNTQNEQTAISEDKDTRLKTWKKDWTITGGNQVPYKMNLCSTTITATARRNIHSNRMS